MMESNPYDSPQTDAYNTLADETELDSKLQRKPEVYYAALGCLTLFAIGWIITAINTLIVHLLKQK